MPDRPRKQDTSPKPCRLGFAPFLNRDVEISDTDDRHTRVTPWIRISEIGEPTVLGAIPDVIELGLIIAAVLQQRRTQWNHLGKDDFRNDAVRFLHPYLLLGVADKITRAAHDARLPRRSGQS